MEKLSSSSADERFARGGKILVVDDEPDVLTVIRMALQKYRFGFDAFNDPLQALEAFSKSPDDYSLVITDVRMPGMTGFELARKIGELRHGIKILYVTAYLAEEMSKQGSGFDRNDVIEKPFSIDRFCKRVRQELNDAGYTEPSSGFNAHYAL